MPLHLALKALPELPANVARPGYAREALSPGIVHFGVGNFHRAHMQVYLDRLFNAGRDLDWAIVGAGVTPYDARMRDALAGQDGLSTVVEQSAERSTARVTGVMTGFVPPMDGRAILAELARPATGIVSLTVTEGGYFIDPATGAFNPANPAIAADVAAPDAPKTVFGLILAGLRARRAAGVAPFTVLSCDNVPHNGVVAMNAVVGLAEAQDPALAAWVRAEVAFPNGMVDRIATATGDRERAITRTEFGIEDAWPVFCEDFIQWVVEDNFPGGRPAFEEVGAEFVSDVTPWEMMKIRILNGGHAIIAYPSGLMDIHFVHEGMENPVVRAFLQKVERDEVIPIVPPVPNTGLDAYFAKVEERCLNPKIGDTIRRLCLDGSNRQPKFIVPVIRDRLKTGGSMDALALESALWCRHCHGRSEGGREITAGDPNWTRLQDLARKAAHDPRAWLSMDDVYGDVAQSAVFQAAFGRALSDIWSKGTARVLAEFVAEH